MKSSAPPAIFLMGPTAAGKTGLAASLVQRLPLEIISVDSALVYRGMNIGTGKPNAATLTLAPHHLLDIRDPTEAYSVAAFRSDALALMQQITQRGNIPLLVGGTMLYFRALLRGLDDLPQADAGLRAQIDAEAAAQGWPALHAELAQHDPITAARLQPTDAQRIQRALEVFRVSGVALSAQLTATHFELPYRMLQLALIPSDRSVLHQRIATRFDAMLAEGLLEELAGLRREFELHEGMTAMRCVGYRQAWEYLDGAIDKNTLRDKGIAATRQLAKRQLTWLRSWPDTVELDCLAEELERQGLACVTRHLQPAGNTPPSTQS